MKNLNFSEGSGKESFDRLTALANEFYEKIPSENVFHLQVEKSNELKKKYPDFVDYVAYHVLVGSTPTIFAKYFDFSGDDSVEKFFRDKISE